MTRPTVLTCLFLARVILMSMRDPLMICSARNKPYGQRLFIIFRKQMQAKNAKCLLFLTRLVQFLGLEVLTRRLVVVDGREAILRVGAGGIVHAAIGAVDALPVLFWYFVGFHHIRT